MKTTESFVHKNLRAVAQASVRKEASLAVYFGPISPTGPKSL